jgi:hypothetical protein
MNLREWNLKWRYVKCIFRQKDLLVKLGLETNDFWEISEPTTTIVWLEAMRDFVRCWEYIG